MSRVSDYSRFVVEPPVLVAHVDEGQILINKRQCPEGQKH